MRSWNKDEVQAVLQMRYYQSFKLSIIVERE